MTETTTTPPTPAADASSNTGHAPEPAATPKRWTRFVTPVLAIMAALIIGLFGGLLIGQNTGGGPGPRDAGFPGSSQDSPMPGDGRGQQGDHRGN